MPFSLRALPAAVSFSSVPDYLCGHLRSWSGMERVPAASLESGREETAAGQVPLASAIAAGQERVESATRADRDAAGSVAVGGSASPAPSGNDKNSRHRWTDDENYLCVKAVVGAGAHVSSYGTRTKRFAGAATAFNAHPQTTRTTDGKRLRDHFYSLKEVFSFKEKKQAVETGTEEAVTALDRLLIDVIEKVADYEQRQKNARAEASVREQTLLAKGAAIRQMAVERRRDRGKAGAASSDRGDSEVNHGAGSAGRAVVEPAQSKRRKIAELDSDDVVEVLERSEQRRHKLAEMQMEMQSRRWDEERKERAEEQARREEHNAEARTERAALVRVLESLVRKLE